MCGLGKRREGLIVEEEVGMGGGEIMGDEVRGKYEGRGKVRENY